MQRQKPNKARAQKEKPVEPERPMRLTVRSIGAKGDGVAVADPSPDVAPDEGDAAKEVYVPYTAPGDVIEAMVSGDRGRITHVISPSAVRTTPPCPHYGRCGGCSLQHVDTPFYTQWKREQVIAALQIVGLDGAVVAPLVELSAATRRRAHFYVERNGETDGGVKMGFYERRSRRLVGIDACQILHPGLHAKLGVLRVLAKAAPSGWPRFGLAVTLCDNGLDVDVASKTAIPDPTPMEFQEIAAAMRAAGVVRLSINGETLITEQAPVISFDGLSVWPPQGGFLQASMAGQEALIARVAQALKGARRIMDLFSGCGTFSLPLARSASVTAYDSDAGAIDALKTAASTARANGLRPVTADVRNLFQRPVMSDELTKTDGIVIDPPRAGAIQQARTLAEADVGRVVYVSCNPKSFARDARILVDGGYQLSSVTPVDQFVWTPHIELVGIFKK